MLKNVICSTIGKKFVMAISGLGLVGFAITHLAGNLALYRSSGDAFNTYAHMLESLGKLLLVAEGGLIAMFLAHVVVAVGLQLKAKTARPTRYAVQKSKGGNTPSNISSRNMIVTGLGLLTFLVLHVWQFKYGPGVEQGYVTEINGQPVRDLYRLVVETFQNPLYVSLYVAVMVFLGLHIRHGFWSAFQSLGIAFPRISRQIAALGVGLAVLLSLGFLFIPIWIFFDLGRFCSSGGL